MFLKITYEEGMEYIGEIIADIMGLNDSRYQWVIDGMSDEEVEQMRRDQKRILREVFFYFSFFFIFFSF